MRDLLSRLALVACLAAPTLISVPICERRVATCKPPPPSAAAGRRGRATAQTDGEGPDVLHRRGESDSSRSSTVCLRTSATIPTTALAALDKAARRAGLEGLCGLRRTLVQHRFILQGFDPDKRSFVGHKAVLEAEIAEVTADKSMSKRDKTAALKELKENLANVDPVQNIRRISRW